MQSSLIRPATYICECVSFTNPIEARHVRHANVSSNADGGFDFR